MNYIEVNYQTWEREECYGMFDYSEIKDIRKHEKLVIKSTGQLLRNSVTYDLVFVDSKAKNGKPLLENCLPFLKIEESQGHFLINNNQEENNSDPLCKIISAHEIGYKLKESDRIRLGKANLTLLRLNWKKNRTKNHYQQIAEPKATDRQSVFADSFYSEQEKASMIESNPACRYCYSKTINSINPFVAVCNCSGHTKYIHQDCLIEWVKKRSGIMNQHIKEGIYYTQAKAFTCEVCKEIYRMDRLIKQVFGVEGEGLAEYAIFYISGEPDMVYVIDLALISEASVGRSLQSSIVINQLSVSRRHCVLTIDQEKKQLILTDLGAKFGTVVEVKKAEIQDKECYQKGRTKMMFTKHQKVSFFERIGFCSPHENLRNERA